MSRVRPTVGCSVVDAWGLAVAKPNLQIITILHEASTSSAWVLENSRDAKPVDVIPPKAATSSARRWIAIRCIFIGYFFSIALLSCVESSTTDHWLRPLLSRVRPRRCFGCLIIFFSCAAAPCVESSTTDHWLCLLLSRVRPTICCAFC